jgi:hypothetical protein
MEPAGLLSTEGLIPGSQIESFAMSSLSRKGARELSRVSFIRALIPFIRAPPHDLLTSQMFCLLIASNWGLRFKHMNSGKENANIQSIAKHVGLRFHIHVMK